MTEWKDTKNEYINNQNMKKNKNKVIDNNNIYIYQGIGG